AVLPYTLSGADSKRMESELGDYCTDALRKLTGADVALMNGGGIRGDLSEGSVTYWDILTAFPFGNSVAVIKASGQQILDALEWGARSLPSGSGGFLQVSGMRYELDTSVPSPCITDERGMCSGIQGERRVRKVIVGDKALDMDRIYTVAGPDYILVNQGDGFTAFDGAELLYYEEGIEFCIAQALYDGLMPQKGQRIKIYGHL
ncbi:MAG: 5'-nucleotidase C-terminal domain-containing protein, partial [Treponema sp.]|nr:5'-nucleotidase C-terminal domain-containing protein [Treponema sp.]